MISARSRYSAAQAASTTAVKAVLRLNGVLVKGGNVNAFRFGADGSRVVYLADQANDELFSLYAAYEPLPADTLGEP